MSNYNKSMLKEGSLEGKVIWVTGGGTGLGKSMVKYFVELGARVAISGRREEKLIEAAEEISKHNVFPVVCDVRESGQVDAALAQIIEHFGTLNGLVNNAAGNFISPTERLSHRAFDIIIDIVLKGSKNCTLSCGKYWIENKIPANVLNIVTTYAWTGSGYVVPSATAKAGVLAMTRSLAVEWAKYGQRHNAIAPGPFPTKGAWDRLFPKEMSDKINLESRVPLKRVGHHQELANLAAYLMSDFSSYVNGEVITIDGGEWLQGAGQFNQMEAITPEEWDLLEKVVRGNQKKS
ncbi:SDR family oxidoreductase [Bacteroidia bacterium]|jgi:NAD(P)-dependent dehydrogenase (short-subunit alcohol dehydrogenase family)|nr:SDR family oxidoreductase [Bacteroidia bacterium]MDC0105034.1 SDR family oxidoreductase [Bacteroidia bacterium]|tara:strand:+ start:285 stop:1160 length:876 start_codon:yes stop_codon:yes gene_type:complete